MERKRAIVVAVVGAALVGLAAFTVGKLAFGGEKTVTRAEYQREIVKARNRVDYALEQMATSASLEELTTRLDQAAEVTRETARDLDGMSVPDGLDGPHDRFVDALNALSGELAGTAGTLRDPDFDDLVPILRSLSFPQWEKANAALTAMRKQGIRVELLSRY
jgi:hypothetical protein